VYFSITGTPDGGRNELSLKNTFSVLVDRITTGKTKSPPEQTAVRPTALPPTIVQSAPAQPVPAHPAQELSLTRLRSLLNKAKAFPLLKPHHPDVVADADVIPCDDHSSVTDFSDYEILLEEAYRFNHDDTLVFRATLKNKTAQSIAYRPSSFTLRAGNRTYPQSVSDAPGVIPPNGESTVYFAVTGTPDGGPIGLSNPCTVMIERDSSSTVAP